jgi:hypothetical protein
MEDLMNTQVAVQADTLEMAEEPFLTATDLMAQVAVQAAAVVECIGRGLLVTLLPLVKVVTAAVVEWAF